MYRLALSTSPSRSMVSARSDASPTSVVPDETAIYQSKLQKELRQAIRDSIIAERVLNQQASQIQLSPQDLKEQRLAKQQWEESNTILRRVAQEQTRLIELARQRNGEESSKMHPRLQQAFAQAVRNQERGQPMQQRVSMSAPDIQEFVREQENALTSVHKKLQRSRKKQQQRQRQPQPIQQHHQKEQLDSDTPQHIVDFIMKQEKELEAVRRKTRSMQDHRPTPTTHHRSRRQNAVSPPRQHAASTTPKVGSFDVYIRQQEEELKKIQQKQHQLQQLSMKKPRPKPAPASPIPSDVTTASSLSEFIREQRMALESYQRSTSQQRQRPPSTPERHHSNHHQKPAPADQDMQFPLVQPRRSITPLPGSFQQRPRDQQHPPSMLVYHNHPPSPSTMEPSYFHDLPSKETIQPLPFPFETIHPSSQETVISGVSDMLSLLNEEEAPKGNPNIIDKHLGMNDNCFCLRHPNQLVCEYTPVFKYDKVKICLVCKSECRAGVVAPPNEMARVIGDIQQLQANKQDWRKKTNVMYNGKTDLSRSGMSVISSSVDDTDDEDFGEDPMTEQQWKEQVRQRVLQVQAWQQKSALKYNSKVAKYFRMLKFGVPMAAVRAECELEGKDIRILTLDPELSLRLQLEDFDVQSRHALLLAFEDSSERNTADMDASQVVEEVTKAFETEYNKTVQHMKLTRNSMRRRR